VCVLWKRKMWNLPMLVARYLFRPIMRLRLAACPIERPFCIC
jgi:hypothetical protein